MGEEEKKPDEGKKQEEEKKDKKKGKPSDNDKKEDEGEKKSQDSRKDAKEEQPAPPPPPPDIVLRVYMHCEGCARKVRKSLRGFNGVEAVITDCKTQKVVVKGEKADPMKVLERVQRKSHRHVELLSPIPKPPSEEEAKKSDEKEPPKAEQKKEEPKVKTVVLKVHMHCEACAQEMKKRIERMKEVEVATPDLKNSQVTVKGTFEPEKLVDYVYRKTAKHAVIVKQEAEEEDKKKAGKDEEKKEGNGKENKEEGKKKDGEGAGGAEKMEEEDVMKVVELRRNESYYYPPKYAMEMYHAYPPQMFSDENPNACSIM